MDITKCKGDGCPLKDKCFRHTAPANEYWQSYFVNPPYKDNTCEYYWENVGDGPKTKRTRNRRANDSAK